MICNNCGMRGHMSRDCNKPIRSYGVILLKDIEKESKIVLINRKDSVCYIDIVRGRYNIHNNKQLRLLFSRITIDEYNKLINDNFENIWKDLWVITEIVNNSDYNYCKNKYTELLKIIDTFKDLSIYKETEWEIPKGKQNKNELYHIAAKRELEEETNINKEDYELIINLSSINELFKGEDDVNYENIYYIGVCKNDSNIKINKENINQINEVKDTGLFTKNEALSKIRDYNVSKLNIINYIFEFVDKYKNDLILK